MKKSGTPPLTPENFVVQTDQSLWQQVVSTIRAVFKQALYLSLLGMAIPALIFNGYFDTASQRFVNKINRLVDNAGGGVPLDFFKLLGVLSEFATKYLGWAAVLSLVFTASYLGLIELSRRHYQKLPPYHAGKLFLIGLRLATPRGWFLGLLIVAMVIASQGLVWPIFIPAILAMMAPAILVVERKGFFRSLFSSIALSYSPSFSGAKWITFFQVMSFGMFFYSLIAIILVCGDGIQNLDELIHIGRGAFTQTFADLPFGTIYVAADTFVTIGVMTAAAFFAVLTTTYYANLTAIRSRSDIPIHEH